MILSLTLLGAMTLASAVVAWTVIRRTGRIFTFRFMLIANYGVVFLISGIVHITNASSSSRGYFDAVTELDLRKLEDTAFLASLGMVVICFGVLSGLRHEDQSLGRIPKPLSRFDLTVLPGLALLLLVVSLWAFSKLQGYISSLESSRVISVSGGSARYSFMSSWFVWAVSFIVILLVCRSKRPPRFAAVLYLVAAVVLIAASLQWNGGRSVVLVMTLPLALVVLGQVRGMKANWPALIGGISVMALYLMRSFQTTRIREVGKRSGSDVSDWLDWQSGRFSMLGFAIQHSEYNGYLFGETIINGVYRFFDGFSRLLGSALPEIAQRSSFEVTAEALLNSSTGLHVVPGLSAELFLNFGILGFVLGHFLLARLCGWVDERYEGSKTAVTQLFWAYVGTLLVFRSIQADSGSLIGLLVFSGAPLLFASAASSLSLRRYPEVGLGSVPGPAGVRRLEHTGFGSGTRSV